MKYNNTVEGIFLERPNRFIAYCMVNGKKERVYVPNTGRCKEIFITGTRVVLSKADSMEKRKTEYTLISAYKDYRLINIDSQSPNAIVEEALKTGSLLPQYEFTEITREKTFHKSRFDIYYERKEGIKGFIEVKGVTLEKDNVCYFPDAPTVRGVKHLNELIYAKEAGYESNVLFLIQMQDVEYFLPNAETHLKFAKTLAKCQEAGINILVYCCRVKADEVFLDKEVPLGDLKQFL